jgi:DNA uptake protein ComE-like DNA-binding protein
MSGNQAAIADLQYRAAKRGEARAMAAAQPMMARELGVGRRDYGQRQFDDGGLVDVNHVPAHVLTAFSGVTPELAARIVECREHLGPNGYTSVEELMAQADLPPHLIEEIREYAIFL